MNAYYLTDVDKIEQAKQYAPTTGLPNQLFQVIVSPNNTKAIVQADWTDVEAMNSIGTFLGELQPDGSAPQAVHEELTKPEWQPIFN